MSVDSPEMLTLSMINGNTGTGFKRRHSNSLIVIGVISRIVVTLSKNTEIIALIMHRIPIKRQIRPRLT